MFYSSAPAGDGLDWLGRHGCSNSQQMLLRVMLVYRQDARKLLFPEAHFDVNTVESVRVQGEQVSA